MIVDNCPRFNPRRNFLFGDVNKINVNMIDAARITFRPVQVFDFIGGNCTFGNFLSHCFTIGVGSRLNFRS